MTATPKWLRWVLPLLLELELPTLCLCCFPSIHLYRGAALVRVDQLVRHFVVCAVVLSCCRWLLPFATLRRFYDLFSNGIVARLGRFLCFTCCVVAVVASLLGFLCVLAAAWLTTTACLCLLVLIYFVFVVSCCGHWNNYNAPLLCTPLASLFDFCCCCLFLFFWFFAVSPAFGVTTAFFFRKLLATLRSFIRSHYRAWLGVAVAVNKRQ